ncbi:hypothetical protein DsansV1_C10g0103361 [Dioscorea sansibarensis]
MCWRNCVDSNARSDSRNEVRLLSEMISVGPSSAVLMRTRERGLHVKNWNWGKQCFFITFQFFAFQPSPPSFSSWCFVLSP